MQRDNGRARLGPVSNPPTPSPPANAPTSERDPLIPSRRGRSGNDPIFALDQEARRRAASGEDIVNATLGALLHEDGRLAILPTAAQTLREVADVDWAAYAPIEGMPAFLEAVRTDVFGAQAEDLRQSVAVATPGGTGALRHAIATFLEPGQAFLTSSFFWGPYQTLADEQERALRTFPMFASREALDLGALDAALGDLLRSQERALLILNDPCHNPCGYSMSAADWRGVSEVVAAHARRAPVTVLLDNAYAAFGPPGAMASAVNALRGLAAHALVLVAWSASKTFTHYGLRTGALIALVRDDLQRRAIEGALATAGRGTWGGCVRGGQVAVARLLQDPALRAAVDAERRTFATMLTARADAFRAAAAGTGLRYPRFQGGFFTTIFSENAADAAAHMRTAGVYVVPLAHGLRVGLCALPLPQIARTVNALCAATQ